MRSIVQSPPTGESSTLRARRCRGASGPRAGRSPLGRSTHTVPVDSHGLISGHRGTRREETPCRGFPATPASSISRARRRRCAAASSQALASRETRRRWLQCSPMPSCVSSRSWPAPARLRELAEAPRPPRRGRALHALAAQAPRSADPVNEFLRLACLTYSQDDPARWAAAERDADAQDRPRLAARRGRRGRCRSHPRPARRGRRRQRAVVGAAPPRVATPPTRSAARTAGRRCCISRTRACPAAPVLAVARLLIEAGADPNAGFLWEGLMSPFTALTGALRARRGRPAATPRLARARPAAARSGRRPQRRPSRLQPELDAGRRVARAAARVRLRDGRRGPVARAARQRPGDTARERRGLPDVGRASRFRPPRLAAAGRRRRPGRPRHRAPDPARAQRARGGGPQPPRRRRATRSARRAHANRSSPPPTRSPRPTCAPTRPSPLHRRRA